ncbi:hypothetical protein HDV05_008014 [Chytridiales sp. JEL 0842]|nr:hypothetical protein HDV05_008014 [Chytridiales sp. JEL 0842]
MQSQSLKQSILTPESLLPEDPEFLPRVLLRTKLIPEIEDAEKNARIEQAVRSEQAGNPLPPPTVNKLDEGAVKSEQRNWEIRVDMHEDIAGHAENIFEGFVDYNLKARLPEDEDLDDSGKPTLKVADSSDKVRLQSMMRWMWTGQK